MAAGASESGSKRLICQESRKYMWTPLSRHLFILTKQFRDKHLRFTLLSIMAAQLLQQGPAQQADPIDTFTQLPLTIDASSKAISLSDPTFQADIEELNRLHRGLLSLDGPAQIPPPPAPVNPKRSVQITKLKDSGNASYKKGAFPDAIKMYDLAIRMASERPSWEASGLVREELSALYNNRAQAHMAQQAWVEGMLDAEVSVELKKVGNVKGWWRRGQCLREMGRLGEAEEWVKQGLEFERAGPDKQGVGELETLMRELNKALENS